ncbi:uncharacterized protein LOC110989132 [Acanthaster planci]|uniref:Uncharacterized protein LOC110989132 n=1 Tax=Acanthaster planci TaxID=133434 RepID=A0A8B7ZTS5_ACAPL|nr:uncharacterized protein LOC110989132 [Acanthaster planci]
MGGTWIPVTVIVLVVTILVPCTRSETGSGSLSQKIRREGLEGETYWLNDVGLTDQQLRQLLANSLTGPHGSTGGPTPPSGGKPKYRLYGNRLSGTGLRLSENEDESRVDTKVTPRGSNLETRKRNGFFYGKRNGFFYGKRSVLDLDNSNECTSCGPQNSGQCVMFGTCCSYSAGGCFFLTDEALPCVTSEMSKCELKGAPCGRDGYGRCVADSVCCSPQEGACQVDAACSKNTFH